MMEWSAHVVSEGMRAFELSSALTVTVASSAEWLESAAWVPALPEKVGVVSLVGAVTGSSVGAGAWVSSTIESGAGGAVLPAASFWWTQTGLVPSLVGGAGAVCARDGVAAGS